MTHRAPIQKSLGLLNLCLRPAPRRPAPSLQPLVQVANLSQQEKKRIKKQEPYRWAQMESRRLARVARHNELERERATAAGSPIHGIPTPFVESFDSAAQEPMSAEKKDVQGRVVEEPHPLPTEPDLLDHQLTRQELDEAIAMAFQLSKPLENTNRIVVDAAAEAQELRDHEARHAKAVKVLELVTSLKAGNGKGRRHANIRRCIDEFGRHNTDKVLEPMPRAPGLPPREALQRGGPDTGSSEVQIAILTAKIRVLAKVIEGPKGNRDKHNKRNLRLLCHRRQKLLQYLHRKERGSQRWTNVIEKLGLTEATWQGQISI